LLEDVDCWTARLILPCLSSPVSKRSTWPSLGRTRYV